MKDIILMILCLFGLFLFFNSIPNQEEIAKSEQEQERYTVNDISERMEKVCGENNYFVERTEYMTLPAYEYGCIDNSKKVNLAS